MAVLLHKDRLLSLATGGIVTLAAIPLLFVAYTSLQLNASEWAGLWSSRMPGLLWNTFLLVILVAAGCLVLGVSAAWLIARRQFPGRTAALWLMVLPLTIPTYVFAYVYTSLLESHGWLGRLWVGLFGEGVPVPDLYNAVGVALILSLSGFSYVFLMSYAALRRSNPHLEEAARIQGATSREVFWHITLPLLRPAIAAGLAVVTLHVLSDFGAVSMLRYQTFTLSIYLQMTGRFDYEAAAGLSLVLVMLALTFLVFERFFRSRQRFYFGSRVKRVTPRRASRGELILIWSWLGLIALLAFVLPLLWMLSWSWTAWTQKAIGVEFWGYLGNSLLVAFAAATIAVFAALPIGYYYNRVRSWLSALYLHLSSIGFVLPGPVVALGALTFILTALPALYGGLLALVLVLVVRFLPLAVQSQESALQQLTPSIEQAGRILGAGPVENLRRVVLPMIRGGMISAWVLVFIDVMKELPATLILRPIGFDTLPVRIWIEASEEMLELAAPAALLLLVGSLPAMWIVMRGEKAR